MTAVEVFVDRGGEPVLVGRAHFTRQRSQISTTFLYDLDYLAAGGGSIDPALPLVTGAQHQSGLVRSFADSAPGPLGPESHREGRAGSCPSGTPSAASTG